MNKKDFWLNRALTQVSETTKLVTDPMDKKKPPDSINDTASEHDQTYKVEILWTNVIFYIVMHTAAIYGFYRLATFSKTRLPMFLFGLGCGVVSAMGVTAAAHRFWTHRTYKATLPLRIILMLMQTFSVQNNIYLWARDHRVHHKYTDTDADPHNSTRGFFFCHMGWLLVKKHPEVKRRGRGIDMSDILNDPVVRFQMKYDMLLFLILSLIIPTWIPMYFWNETFEVAFFMSIGRWVLSLHLTWFVNSVAHMWGSKPYDKSISPTENLFVGITAFGEGWHNYHHVYPWDYKAAELGNYRFNWTTAFIDICAYLGLAYDLKTVPEEMIRKRIQKTGDHSLNNHSNHDVVWGWNDIDMTQEDKAGTEIVAEKR